MIHTYINTSDKAVCIIDIEEFGQEKLNSKFPNSDDLEKKKRNQNGRLKKRPFSNYANSQNVL